MPKYVNKKAKLISNEMNKPRSRYFDQQSHS